MSALPRDDEGRDIGRYPALKRAQFGDIRGELAAPRLAVDHRVHQTHIRVDPRAFNQQAALDDDLGVDGASDIAEASTFGFKPHRARPRNDRDVLDASELAGQAVGESRGEQLRLPVGRIVLERKHDH